MSKDLILVGGGGHCRACIDVIEAQGAYRIAGIVDVRENVGAQVSGYPVIGTDDDLAGLVGAGRSFLVTLGQVRTADHRRRLFALLDGLSAQFATIIAPSALVSRTARIGRGSIVMHHALVATGAEVGDNCILNDKSLVEHDARVEAHCHVSTGAILNGAASVGEGCFIGSGAVLSHEVFLAPGCVIGAGAVVHKSLPALGVYAGNPLRRLADA
jgi:sugar O-acyltransferase (sialic acid O-acetyltransferase NeuD family)